MICIGPLLFKTTGSRFQLAPDLIEEAPVGALGQELLGRALEHPDLLEAQGVEAQSVLGAIIAPTVGELLYGLQGIVVALGVAVVDDELRGLRGLACADIRRLQDG